MMMGGCLQVSLSGSIWLAHIDGRIIFYPTLYYLTLVLDYLESMNSLDADMLLFIRESSTTSVVSLTRPLARTAFYSSSSRLSKARSMEASFFWVFEGRASPLFRRLVPKQKQQLFDSVINLKLYNNATLL